jgi:hypothetical protein
VHLHRGLTAENNPVQILRTSLPDHVNRSDTRPPLVTTVGIGLDPGLSQDPAFSLLSAEIPKYLGSSLSGVECHNSSGAKHRCRTTAKLKRKSRPHRSHRSRRLHPRCWLLPRLLQLPIAPAFTDP